MQFTNNQVLKYGGVYEDKVLFIVPNILFTKLIHYMMTNGVENKDICATILYKKDKFRKYVIGGIPSAFIKTKNMKRGDEYMVSFTIIKNQLYVC